MAGAAAQQDLDELVDSEHGFVSARIFGDQQLYARELDTVFAESWLFVARESEIPDSGEFGG